MCVTISMARVMPHLSVVMQGDHRKYPSCEAAGSYRLPWLLTTELGEATMVAHKLDAAA